MQFALIWALETGADETGIRETMNAYLATSRDNKPWNLEWTYGDQPLIPRGEPGRFDCRWIQPAPSIVTWNDRHWLYYAGLARSHAGQWSPEVTGPKGGIGLATIRRDGFVSLNAGAQRASITTKPVQFQGNRLAINAVTAPTGSARVEIQNAAGQPFSGFTLADNTAEDRYEISGDKIRHTVRWKTGDDVSQFAGKPVRLRIELKDADLYSIQFTTKE
ncbi:MAG TPA: hypothetical protein QF564_08180 [Pirellulaceae bacterium]|nr:hypothetical protein [Pirellulaceae bacterium]